MEVNFPANTGPGQLIAIDGGNFSGRTDLLRRLTGLEQGGTKDFENKFNHLIKPEHPAVYIGPEIYYSISGLALTVQEELYLHSRNCANDNHINWIIEQLGLYNLYPRNPFTLSGGEQVCLAILSALSLRPSILGIDCALEQLEVDLKNKMLKIMKETCSQTMMLLADNQLQECGNFDITIPLLPQNKNEVPGRDYCFGSINPNLDLSSLSMKPCRIDIKGLSFHYPSGPTVLRDFEVLLEPNTTYTLRGKNGVGKSTFAKLLSGILRPDKGKILVNGIDGKMWKQPGKIVAYHFQNPDVQLFATSVQNELLAGPRALGIDEKECMHRAALAAAMFGLSDLLNEHPLDLPFVIRKRVALAATIVMGRPWLILDEPTLGQDKPSSEAIAQIIRNLIAIGTGVIVISHSNTFLKNISGKEITLQFFGN